MKLTQIDWNRLHVFFHVYQSKGILNAANELHLTRAAVSIQLKKLEEEIGFKLFFRVHSKLVATDKAHSLFEVVRDFRNRLGTHQNLSLKNSMVGQIVFGAPEVFGARFVLPCLNKFKRLYPGIRFEIKLALTFPLIQALQSEVLDLAIIDLADTFTRGYPVHLDRLATEEQTLICSKQYLKKIETKKISYQRLLDYEYVTYNPQASAEKLWFNAIYNQTPSKLKVSMSILNMFGIIDAVKDGMGIGLIPKYLVQKELKSGSLCEVVEGGASYKNSMDLVSPLRTIEEPHVQVLRKFLLENLRLDL